MINDPTQVDESLIRLAEGWKTRTTVAGTLLPGFGITSSVIRCAECEEMIFHQDLGETLGVVRHLMNSHGYRMDGRRFNDQNEEIGHA